MPPEKTNDQNLQFDFLTIKAVAALLGVHPGTIRRWERVGIIPPATRRLGIRVYRPEDVDRIRATVFQIPNERLKAS